MLTSEAMAQNLSVAYPLTEGSLTLEFPDFTVTIRSNEDDVLDQLGQYFSPFIGTKPADKEIWVLNGDPVQLAHVTFTDWAREPGKAGRKDAIHDLADGRLIHKVRTGMVFLQSQTHLIAAGPCSSHDNQVINFITSQHMNHLQQNGALICHAAGLVINGSCLGLAGLSGGGKSTLMLSMLAEADATYVTNDRLFVRQSQNGPEAVGIAKMPRINPGTILNNPILSPMIDDARQAELKALPIEDLWHLEEKYDAMVDDLYGLDKITPVAPLSSFLILNWDRRGAGTCQVHPVDLSARPDLLPALMKSPGPFYQDTAGRFISDSFQSDPKAYVQALENVTILEATGRIDFEAAAQACLHHMRQKT